MTDRKKQATKHRCLTVDRYISTGTAGAMTFGAKGCYFAEWGCRSEHAGYIHRDTWAELHENAANDEAACLHRAAAEWVYCGSPANRPYTSIYGPTG